MSAPDMCCEIQGDKAQGYGVSFRVTRRKQKGRDANRNTGRSQITMARDWVHKDSGAARGRKFKPTRKGWVDMCPHNRQTSSKTADRDMGSHRADDKRSEQRIVHWRKQNAAVRVTHSQHPCAPEDLPKSHIRPCAHSTGSSRKK